MTSLLESLPDELLFQELLFLPANDVHHLCQASRRIYNLCDNYLWQKLIHRDFPTLPVPALVDFHRYYLELSSALEELSQELRTLPINSSSFGQWTDLILIRPNPPYEVLLHRHNSTATICSDVRFVGLNALDYGVRDRISSQYTIPSDIIDPIFVAWRRHGETLSLLDQLASGRAQILTREQALEQLSQLKSQGYCNLIWCAVIQEPLLSRLQRLGVIRISTF